MKISVLTLFPDIVRHVLGSSITGKAWEKEIFSINLVQIRDFAVNSYGQVDDACYGGGPGMLMMAEPVYRAWDQARKWHKGEDVRTILLSPRGSVYRQSKALELAQQQNLIFICGHYEGIDQRLIDEIVDEEISLGDYILTGGEIAVCAVLDSVLRLVPGVLPSQEAYSNESHMDGLLEYPQYTRPAEWRGKKVPDVLLSGHKANIEKWQEIQSVAETMRLRPDLNGNIRLSLAQWQEIIAAIKEKETEEKAPDNGM